MNERIEQERKNFEGWAMKQGLRIHKDEHGEYCSSRTEDCFDSWLAALGLEE